MPSRARPRQSGGGASAGVSTGETTHSREARPFSPSPPRDTRHTSSRPPSLLFGARPPTASVATSSSFDLSGLPTTRGRNVSSGAQGYFALADTGAGAGAGAGSIRRNDRCAVFYAVQADGSNDSLSTTSSASPPLGATSILSALEGDNLSLPVSRAAHARDPTPPDAFPADSVPSSPTHSVKPSRSMPRLHQPTVIRRPSGRIAFLPHSASPASPHADETMRSIHVASELDHRSDRSARHSIEYRRPTSYASSSSFDSFAISRFDPDRTVSTIDSSLFSTPNSKVLQLKAQEESKEEEMLHEVIPPKEGYKAPYVVRAVSRNRQYPGPSGEPDTATFTFQAGISRQPDDGPLPFGTRHIELRLAWTAPETWTWIPGRKYVPQWSLEVVKGQEREGTARWIVKGVVSQLPVVWRLANWL